MNGSQLKFGFGMKGEFDWSPRIFGFYRRISVNTVVWPSVFIIFDWSVGWILFNYLLGC